MSASKELLLLFSYNDSLPIVRDFPPHASFDRAFRLLRALKRTDLLLFNAQIDRSERNNNEKVRVSSAFFGVLYNLIFSVRLKNGARTDVLHVYTSEKRASR